MHFDEFTDTYSDDIIYLRQGRIALLTHPLLTENVELCNASFCRLYAIMMIGSIEAMLERWRSRDSRGILVPYFARGTPNQDRVRSLRDAFVTNGINVKHDVFDDYLAIKYLRNAIMHASWNNDHGQFKRCQADWIEARGFPKDTRKLDAEHWEKIEWVDKNMMFYIALTGAPSIQPPPDLGDVGIPARPLPKTTGIIAPSEWSRLYLSNLERISAVISEQIKVAALTPEHYWARGLSPQEVKVLPENEKKRRYFMAAKAAATNGFEPLISLSNYVENAIMCWSEYVRLIPEFYILDSTTVQDVTRLFRVIHDRRIFPKNGIFPEWAKDMPEDVSSQIIRHSFDNIDPLTADEIKTCHRIGAIAKRAFINIMPLALFSIQLPILAPNRTKQLEDTATYIADIFEVGLSWYSFVECQAFQPETIDFYREMSRLLNASAKAAS